MTDKLAEILEAFDTDLEDAEREFRLPEPRAVDVEDVRRWRAYIADIRAEVQAP